MISNQKAGRIREHLFYHFQQMSKAKFAEVPIFEIRLTGKDA